MAEQLDWVDIGLRVRQARIAAGLTQEQLAKAIKLERTMLVKVEAGDRHLDALELSRVSTVLHLPMAHFLTRPPEILSRRTELVSDLDTDAARNAYMLEAELASWLRDVRQLIALDVLVPRELLRYPDAVRHPEDARSAARWLRTELGVGNAPLGPLIHVCEQAGQLLLVSDTPGEGASVVDSDVAVSVVSRRGDPGRRRATAAHELGHLVIGDEYSTDLGVHSSREDRESAVDAFAAELLLPVSVVAAETPASPRLAEVRAFLVELAAKYRASWTLVLRQAELAKVVDQRRQLASRVPTRAELMDVVGWVPEPDLERTSVPPSIATAVMAAWRQGRITPQRASELTHGQIAEDELLGSVDDREMP
jgi:transcriptional regulator with XRE-family HTH domain